MGFRCEGPAKRRRRPGPIVLGDRPSAAHRFERLPSTPSWALCGRHGTGIAGWDLDDGQPNGANRVDDRDQRIARAFVAAADTLAEGFDLATFLAGLAHRCVELFETVEAGVLVEAAGGPGHAPPVVASSTHAVQRLGLLELHHDHGPCTDSLRSGEAVGCCDLSAATDRWPTFAPEARAAGFSSVHALPMRVHDEIIGALNLFVRTPGGLRPPDLATAQAVADVASISILRRRATEAARVLADQLQHALDSRVRIEQAKGILSERCGLDADEAFAAMRRFARERRLKLADVVRGVVDRTLATDVIVPTSTAMASASVPHRPPPGLLREGTASP